DECGGAGEGVGGAGDGDLEDVGFRWRGGVGEQAAGDVELGGREPHLEGFEGRLGAPGPPAGESGPAFGRAPRQTLQPGTPGEEEHGDVSAGQENEFAGVVTTERGTGEDGSAATLSISRNRTARAGNASPLQEQPFAVRGTPGATRAGMPVPSMVPYQPEPLSWREQSAPCRQQNSRRDEAHQGC